MRLPSRSLYLQPEKMTLYLFVRNQTSGVSGVSTTWHIFKNVELERVDDPISDIEASSYEGDFAHGPKGAHTI